MTTQSIPLIYSLIPKISAAIGAVGKDQRNTQQGYQFRGIDSVVNALKPALNEHGVFYVPSILSVKREMRETKAGNEMIATVLEVKFTFYAPDGSSIEAITTGEGMDTADKSCNKALSGALKYALTHVFSISTKENEDSEFHSPEPTVSKKTSGFVVNKQTGEVVNTATKDDMKELTAFAKKHGWDSERLQNYCLALDGVNKDDFWRTFTKTMLAETKAFIIEASANEAFQNALR